MGNRVNEDVISAVRYIVGFVKYIVDNPNDVEINVRPGAYRIVVELYTNSKDVGQVIGRNGHVVASIRSLLSAIAGKNRIKIDFDFVTEDDNFRKHSDYYDNSINMT